MIWMWTRFIRADNQEIETLVWHLVIFSFLSILRAAVTTRLSRSTTALDLPLICWQVNTLFKVFQWEFSAGLTITLEGTVADGDVFVLAQSSADAAILSQADQTNGAGWFNGDDVIVCGKAEQLAPLWT
jgi:hypothetical protein